MASEPNTGQPGATADPKIVVHHLENSRSQRILWLLEELGLPYDVQRYQRDRRTMLAPEALLRVHPLGKSPIVTDGGNVLAESGAIVEYLVDRYGRQLAPPADSPERLRYTYWLHFAEGSAMPPLVMKLIFGRLATAPMPFFVKPIARGIAKKLTETVVTPNLQRQLAFMESELGRSQWFAGDEFSAADIQMSFPVEASAARGGLDSSSHPKLAGFLARIHARPAYQRALERGGPYRLMK
jgi:glutathione S-transferase